MDPVSQAAIGAAAAQSGSRAKTLRHALWIGALAGMAPDLDVFIRSSDDPLLALEFHRQFTHSLFFIPVGAFICASIFYPLIKKQLPFKAVFLRRLDWALMDSWMPARLTARNCYGLLPMHASPGTTCR